MRYGFRDYVVLLISTVTGWQIATIDKRLPGGRARRGDGRKKSN